MLIFENKCLRALVGCIDFITPSRKKKRSPDKYVRQQSWKKFLDSDVTKINWNGMKQIAETNRMVADNYTCNKSIRRVAAMLQNLVAKNKSIVSEKEILDILCEYSGYVLSKAS